MIDILLDLGLTETDIKMIREDVDEIDQNDFKSNIKLLKALGCDNSSIKNIIIGNPFFLHRSNRDFAKLISYIQQLGFTHINLLFDSYPFFLNKDDFEIRDFIEKRLNIGEELEDIIDEIDSNPMIIDEV